jgi:hypothetical protein
MIDVFVVAADLSSRCAAGSPIQLSEESGYIASPTLGGTAQNVPGHAPLPVDSVLHSVTRPCLWQIRVAPGQRINLTLLDFGRHFRSSGSPGHFTLPSGPAVQQTNFCIKYAVVTESLAATAASGWSQTTGGEPRTADGTGSGKARSDRSATVCGGGGANDALRQRLIYASETNAVDVETFTVSHAASKEWAESEAGSASVGGGTGSGPGGSDGEGLRFLIRYDGK